VRTTTRHQAARNGRPWRPLAALGALGLLGAAWVVVPDLGQGISIGRINAAVAGQSQPLPVASDFAPMDATAPAQSASSPVIASPVPSVTASPAPPSAAPLSSAAATSPLATATGQSLPEDSRGDIPRQGPGTYQLAPGGTGVVGGGGTLVTYSVEIEDSVPLDPVAVAARVDQILGDSRSWIGLGQWRLQRVDTGADARIVVASPGTTDNLCYPLRTSSLYSCRNGPFVVLNADRWAGGAQSWGADVHGYREYLVNHEFGHFLGFSHTPCPASGSPAPVMLQQTKGLFGCTANAWPTVA